VLKKCLYNAKSDSTLACKYPGSKWATITSEQVHNIKDMVTKATCFGKPLGDTKLERVDYTNDQNWCKLVTSNGGHEASMAKSIDDDGARWQLGATMGRNQMVTGLATTKSMWLCWWTLMLQSGY